MITNQGSATRKIEDRIQALRVCAPMPVLAAILSVILRLVWHRDSQEYMRFRGLPKAMRSRIQMHYDYML